MRAELLLEVEALRASARMVLNALLVCSARSRHVVLLFRDATQEDTDEENCDDGRFASDRHKRPHMVPNV